MDIFGAKSLLILQALDYRYVILTSKMYINERVWITLTLEIISLALEFEFLKFQI